MSRQNVEIVRQAFEAFMRRDNEAALRLYDREVEIHGRFDNSVVYRGLTGVREFFRDEFGVMEWRAEVEEWFGAGDQVVAVMRTWGRGKKSGAPFERRESHVWTLRDGKLWRLRLYATKAEALEAVGLEG